MADNSSIHPFVQWSKNRLDEMDAGVLQLEDSVNEAEAEIQSDVQAALAEAKQRRDEFKTQMGIKFEVLESKGDKALQSTKKQLQKTWQSFEDSVDTTVTKLNTGRKEFEARAEAQLSSFQQTIECYEKAAVGAAVTQKENLNAAVERMQDKMQDAKDHFADLGQVTSNSWEAYREALGKSREAFEDAYETTKWEIRSV